jgi:1-acyl-sn-glycerol-3-phosphate acyltransferase
MLRRRLVTIPAIVVAFVLVTATLPLLLTLALLAGSVRRRGRLALARLVLMLEAFLAIEVLVLAVLALLGLVTLGSRARRAALTWPLQRFFTGAQMAAARVIFGLRFVVEGAELAAAGGPVVVLIRHASVVDVLLPSVFIANVHRIRLRYVLKRELLLDPCLDVAGHWIPNHFVARDGTDSQREFAAVRALKAGLGAGDGVLIYPEGTRFTEAKRRKALDRARDDPAALARALRLRHLLPVRPGGPLALLETAPTCDVLFVGHHGLEGATSATDLWKGDLVGRTIRIKFWRAPAASLPEGRDARLAWLGEAWQRMDDWLDAGEADRVGSAAGAEVASSTQAP